MEEAAAWEAGAHAWVERVRESAHHAHDDAIRSLLPPPGGLALDAGCGEGRWTRELRAAGYDVVGVDRSAALVDEARRADPEGRYETGELEALPFGGGAAALVLCVNVLPHVVELRPVVREIARVLQPAGVAVIGTAHPVAIAGSFDEDAGELRLRGYFAEEAHGVPLGEHHVFHQHRTIEGYVRAFLDEGFVLDDLREVAGWDGAAPRYLDLRFTRRPA